MNRFLFFCTFIFLQLVYSAGAVCQTREEFDNMIFMIPPGFNATKTASSMSLTSGDGGNGQYCNITINKSIFSLKKMEKSFPEAWRESLVNDGVDNPATEPSFVKASTSSGWNYFRGGKLVQYNAQQPAFYYHLIMVRYLGLTIRIITRANSEDVFMQKYPMLIQMVSSINFKTQPPPQNNNQTVFSNQSNSGYSQSVQLNKLYISIQGDIMTNGSLSILYFLPGGKVFTDIPEKGFLNFNIQEQQSLSPQLVGSYSTVNNTVSVQMSNQNGANTLSLDQDGSIRSNAGELYRKIEPLDSYLFEGTYINKQDPASGKISFYKDGRFEDNGLIKSIQPKGAAAFADGKGNYSSQSNSLTLQYSDGRQLQLCFYMLPEDYANAGQPGKVFLNNYILLRQP